MRLRTTIYAIFTALVLATAIGFSMPAHHAQASTGDVNIEPPAPIYEVSPGTRAGYTWSDGCWQWDGQRHRWHPGYWVADRAGYTWVPDNWEKRGKLWHYNKGHWEKDDSTVVADDKPVASDDSVAADNDSTAAKPAKGKRRKPVTHTSNNYNDASIWPFHKRD